MKKRLVLIVWIVLTTLTLNACAPRVRTTTTTTLSPEEGAAYAAEVNEIVENMLTGLSENDWAMFSRDIHTKVLKLFESDFQQKWPEIIGVLGAYQSKTLDHVDATDNKRDVFYHAVFENNPDVTIQVTFNTYHSKNLVTGLGFDYE